MPERVAMVCSSSAMVFDFGEMPIVAGEASVRPMIVCAVCAAAAIGCLHFGTSLLDALFGGIFLLLV
jgi:hypothetical protein